MIGIILAGGLGRRLGGSGKPFIMLAGRSMFERVACRFSRQVDKYIVSANVEPDRFRQWSVPVIADSIPHPVGPLAGILAGMRWAETHRPDVGFIVSVAADTPFFPGNLVHFLADSRGADQKAIALAASATGVHPTFGLWPTALADDLEEFLCSGAKPGVLAFADRYACCTVPFDNFSLPGGVSVDPFFNVNTPRDVGRAEVIAAALDAADGERE